MFYTQDMRKGFTLIELMVVVIIIGILAAIAIPNFVKLTYRAKKASMLANMHTTQVAVELYPMDNNYTGYPPNAAVLKSELPPNFKNPYNKSDSAIQDESQPNIPGVVEYKADSSNKFYQITGIDKDSSAINLTLTPSHILY